MTLERENKFSEKKKFHIPYIFLISGIGVGAVLCLITAALENNFATLKGILGTCGGILVIVSPIILAFEVMKNEISEEE